MYRKDFLKRSCAFIAASVFANAKLFTAEAAPAPSPKKEESESLDAAIDTPITLAVIGYGGRGTVYGAYAHHYPKSVKVVAVSDINDFRKDKAAQLHDIAPDKCFGDWSELFEVPKFCDALIISLPDELHYACCLKALEAGYHVLLEKPVAQTEAQCLDILSKAQASGKIVGICHVLRYAPYFIALKKAIKDKKIGDIVSIQHFEAIECVHMSHSFVRGNWSNSQKATPMIISKSCHDLDILRWLIDAKCEKVSAFGSLKHFRPENAPAGATKRCLDGCAVEGSCPFSAKYIYMERGVWLHVFDGLSSDKATRMEQLRKYLAESDYGKCVYYSNNDQCDNYVMNMCFENGVTVGFQMEGLTTAGTRFTRIQGTKGDIVGDMKTFTLTDFRTRKTEVFDSNSKDGHGGGDWRLLKDFARAVFYKDATLLTSTIEASIESHVIGFAAERSRASGAIIHL